MQAASPKMKGNAPTTVTILYLMEQMLMAPDFPNGMTNPMSPQAGAKHLRGLHFVMVSFIEINLFQKTLAPVKVRIPWD